MKTEHIVAVQPRRGRGPAYIKFESVELSTFDAVVIQRAASSVGCLAEFDMTTTVKGDKTYNNLTSLTILEPTEPISLQPLEPLEARPPSARSSDPTPYVLFDRADDEAIIARMKGRALKAYVYAFNQQGSMIYGLGVDGAEACKRELARTGEVIEEESVSLVKDSGEAAYFEAKVSRWAVNPAKEQRIKLDTALGFKRQAKFMPAGTPNSFWFEQGCSKALRNAVLRLTPEEIKQRVIEAYKDSARRVVPEEPPPAVPPPTGLPPIPPDKQFLLVRLRELRDQLQLPTGMWESLWDRFVGKGLKAEDADPVGLQELCGYLHHRSKTGEWPETEGANDA